MIGTLLVATLLAAATAVVAADGEAGQDTRTTEDQMALLLDRSRVAAGVLPLARSAALDRAATTHARDMAAQGYMEHEAPDGSSPASRAADAGYVTPSGGAWLVVEVISARGDPPDAAVDWWLGDGLHRRVVLRPTWREMGVGFARGGPYGRFWVALFGCRPNVLPPVLLDGVLGIPDESCGHSLETFGRVQSTRAARTPEDVATAEWGPYAPERPWPPGQPAVVQLRDDTGRVLEVTANDMTSAAAELP